MHTIMKFILTILGWSRSYFTTSCQLIVNPAGFARRISDGDKFDADHISYLATGLCLMSSVWMLSSILFKVNFPQFQIYCFEGAFSLVYIYTVAFSVWVFKYRKKPIKYTIIALSYVIGLIMPLAMFVIEIFHVFALFPSLFSETNLCPVRTFDCLLDNYSIIGRKQLDTTDGYIVDVFGFFAVLYMMQAVIIIQEVTVITFLVVLAFNYVFQNYIMINLFLIAIAFLKARGLFFT